jgi:hypothetical protein
MKPPTRAPCYAAMYHALCDTARKHGYALAIHGTVTTDLDLIAVPWTDEAAPAETVVEALRTHLAFVETVPAELCTEQATPKPHGRKAWNLYMDHGGKVDLSVMPRAN